MIDYKIIASGSTGNATVINGNILIDCGVSVKALRPYIRDLNLVLLTHEHGDHFRASTVRELHRQRPTLRFGCCEWMVKHLLDAGVKPVVIDVYEIQDDTCYIYRPDFSVRPVRLTHNVPNCGYVIVYGGDTLLYATDTGSMDGITEPGLDLYLIEGNHSEAEIAEIIAEKEAAGEFCYESAAALNHLSKEKALEWLAQNMGPHSKFIFMHQHIRREEATDGRGQNAQGNNPHVEDG